jgi:glutathione S-transferase
MLKIYGISTSGNCYKPKLLLGHLGIPFTWVEVDARGGETKSAAFLAMNPFGRTPVLEIEPGVHLAESGAILCYLAEGTPYFPGERLARARVLEWMFFEQNSHEPYVANARYIAAVLKKEREYADKLEELRARGYAALKVMETQLTQHDFLAEDRYTIADIALYAYTHVAGEGGFDLESYPAIKAWIGRVEGQEGYVPMVADRERTER